jgi:hypothetical protein
MFYFAFLDFLGTAIGQQSVRREAHAPAAEEGNLLESSATEAPNGSQGASLLAVAEGALPESSATEAPNGPNNKSQSAVEVAIYADGKPESAQHLAVHEEHQRRAVVRRAQQQLELRADGLLENKEADEPEYIEIGNCGTAPMRRRTSNWQTCGVHCKNGNNQWLPAWFSYGASAASCKGMCDATSECVTYDVPPSGGICTLRLGLSSNSAACPAAPTGWHLDCQAGKVFAGFTIPAYVREDRKCWQKDPFPALTTAPTTTTPTPTPAPTPGPTPAPTFTHGSPCTVTLYEHWPAGMDDITNVATIPALSNASSNWGGSYPTGQEEVLSQVGVNLPLNLTDAVSSVKVEGACCKVDGYIDESCTNQSAGYTGPISSTTDVTGVPQLIGIVTPATGLVPLWGCNDCVKCVKIIHSCSS